MTRYYYTDPLAAAWMAKHHGMKLQSLARDTNDPYWDIVFIGGSPFRQGQLIKVADSGPFYIHPDSRALLRVREKDMITYGGRAATIIGVYENNDVLVYGETVFARSVEDSLIRIIQRNGIPFMWPESTAGGIDE